MEISRIQQLKYKTIPSTSGDFERKPNDAKTVAQWLALGRKPVSENCIVYYKMPFNPSLAYAYVRESDTEELLEEEAKCIALSKQPTKAEVKKNEAIALLEKAGQFANSNVVCFDTETTGFSPTVGDEILQISIVDKNGILFESYLKPHNKTSWYPSQQVHGITPAMVKNSPFAEDVKDRVVDIFSSADAIIGHNVSFDIRFVEACFGYKFDENKVLDTMKLFRADSPGEDSYSLEAAVKHYCPGRVEDHLGGAHNSTTDTISTMDVFMSIAEKYKEKPVEKETEEDKEV